MLVNIGTHEKLTPLMHSPFNNIQIHGQKFYCTPAAIKNWGNKKQGEVKLNIGSNQIGSAEK